MQLMNRQQQLPHARKWQTEALKMGDDPVVDGLSVLIVQDSIGAAANEGEDQE